mmetsp:Transcript_36745/g.82783  ORF Transcript_36745/g.82783 Transcript_36745/m.82783 type:complete len:293 (-) Transcript_36745:314-1192(-)
MLSPTAQVGVGEFRLNCILPHALHLWCEEALATAHLSLLDDRSFLVSLAVMGAAHDLSLKVLIPPEQVVELVLNLLHVIKAAFLRHSVELFLVELHVHELGNLLHPSPKILPHIVVVHQQHIWLVPEPPPRLGVTEVEVVQDASGQQVLQRLLLGLIGGRKASPNLLVLWPMLREEGKEARYHVTSLSHHGKILDARKLFHRKNIIRRTILLSRPKVGLEDSKWVVRVIPEVFEQRAVFEDGSVHQTFELFPRLAWFVLVAHPRSVDIDLTIVAVLSLDSDLVSAVEHPGSA